MQLELKELVKLYEAMTECFNEIHIRRICRILKCDYKMFERQSIQDSIRELVLWANRGMFISVLIDSCRQVKSDFHWEDRCAIAEVTNEAKEVSLEHLIMVMARYFSPDDLKMMCFYLGVRFDIIRDYRLDWDRGGRRLYLSELGVDVEGLSDAEVETMLKELWVDDFVSWWRHRDDLAKVAAVCLHLRPDAFSG